MCASLIEIETKITQNNKLSLDINNDLIKIKHNKLAAEKSAIRRALPDQFTRNRGKVGKLEQRKWKIKRYLTTQKITKTYSYDGSKVSNNEGICHWAVSNN
jgi:hypothetical protein